MKNKFVRDAMVKWPSGEPGHFPVGHYTNWGSGLMLKKTHQRGTKKERELALCCGVTSL